MVSSSRLVLNLRDLQGCHPSQGLPPLYGTSFAEGRGTGKVPHLVTDSKHCFKSQPAGREEYQVGQVNMPIRMNLRQKDFPLALQRLQQLQRLPIQSVHANPLEANAALSCV